jgi:hypothetical protein
MDALQPQKARGMTLLYQHCTAVDAGGELPEPAADRLESLIGGELTRFLLAALVRDGRAHAAA